MNCQWCNVVKWRKKIPHCIWIKYQNHRKTQNGYTWHTNTWVVFKRFSSHIYGGAMGSNRKWYRAHAWPEVTSPEDTWHFPLLSRTIFPPYFFPVLFPPVPFFPRTFSNYFIFIIPYFFIFCSRIFFIFFALLFFPYFFPTHFFPCTFSNVWTLEIQRFEKQHFPLTHNSSSSYIPQSISSSSSHNVEIPQKTRYKQKQNETQYENITN